MTVIRFAETHFNKFLIYIRIISNRGLYAFNFNGTPQTFII